MRVLEGRGEGERGKGYGGRLQSFRDTEDGFTAEVQMIYESNVPEFHACSNFWDSLRTL